VTIRLWTALPNVGGATMLAQASATGTQGRWVDVFWNAVPVTVGLTYLLAFTGNTSLGMAGDTSDPYPDGQAYANSGYLSYPAYDDTVRTYAPIENVPTLGRLGLIVAMLLVLGAGLVVLRRLA
jgi:hypothetical protein